MNRALMRLQHRVATDLKNRVLTAGPAPRTVRFGVSAKAVMLLDRHHDMQRELGLYEREAVPIYRRWIRSDSVVFDVGAADGYTALGFAALAESGHVIAFEADSTECDRFTRNLTLNPSLASRIHLLTAFVGDGATEASDSIDQLMRVRQLPQPDFIKIDVEGAEVVALAGMAGTLTAARPVVYVEVHSRNLEDRCAQFLRQLGYRVEVVRPKWWRAVYPEYRPLPHNRWLLATPNHTA